MNRIRRLTAVVTILCSVTAMSDLAGRLNAWAQPVPHYDGEYTITDLEQSTDKRGVWAKSSQLKYVPTRLFLSTYQGKNAKYQGRLVYAWVNSKGKSVEYSEYDVTKPGNIWLCASQYSGDVEQLAGHNKYRVRLLMPPDRGLEYRFTLDMQGGITGNPFPEGDPAPCAGRGGVVSKSDLTALTPRAADSVSPSPGVNPEGQWPVFHLREGQQRSSSRHGCGSEAVGVPGDEGAARVATH